MIKHHMQHASAMLWVENPGHVVRIEYGLVKLREVRQPKLKAGP